MRCIGYHFVIYRDGSIHVGRAIEEVGAHCKGHNSISIGICYIGGLSKKGKPKDTRTRDQKAAMRSLIEQLKEEYPLATIHGHNEFANKACPCFDVKKEVGEGVNTKIADLSQTRYFLSFKILNNVYC